MAMVKPITVPARGLALSRGCSCSMLQIDRGGLRVAVRPLDPDAFADIITSTGPAKASNLQLYDHAALTSGIAASAFQGGVFVG
jgi:hypothetical protein